MHAVLIIIIDLFLLRAKRNLIDSGLRIARASLESQLTSGGGTHLIIINSGDAPSSIKLEACCRRRTRIKQDLRCCKARRKTTAALFEQLFVTYNCKGTFI